MKHTTVNASAHKKPDSGHKGQPHRVEIEKAENGFTVRTHRKQEGDMMRNYQPPEEHVFQKGEEMTSHVLSQFGQQVKAPVKAIEKAGADAKMKKGK